MKTSFYLVLILLFAGICQVNGQSNQIKGVVKLKPDGESVPGASIVVAGTVTGTVSDKNGQFCLNIPDEYNTLCISFIGLRTKLYDISDKKDEEIEILMEPDIVGLDEITIVYDTVKGRSYCFPYGYEPDTIIISGIDK
jgi:hypothetical protein